MPCGGKYIPWLIIIFCGDIPNVLSCRKKQGWNKGLGSRSNEYKDCCLLACDVVSSMSVSEEYSPSIFRWRLQVPPKLLPPHAARLRGWERSFRSESGWGLLGLCMEIKSQNLTWQSLNDGAATSKDYDILHKFLLNMLTVAYNGITLAVQNSVSHCLYICNTVFNAASQIIGRIKECSVPSCKFMTCFIYAGPSSSLYDELHKVLCCTVI
jgi:hypothetical protein